ncbi:MAG: fibronectin type III domain-containing protein [Candidatus Moraniibacteriota bacterium]|nr:MAG: fibronectin type III domain-containing protein [Candidatus Moranbacteria bacterium]
MSSFAQTTPEPPSPYQALPPQNLTATVVSGSAITLSWNAPTGGWLVMGYRVYRCQGASCTPTVEVGTTNASTRTYADTGLTPGASYTYVVTTYGAFPNDESEKTATVSATSQTRLYNINDFTTLVGQWNQSGSGITSDVNSDSVVNTKDIGVMMSSWE